MLAVAMSTWLAALGDLEEKAEEKRGNQLTEGGHEVKGM